ncbi:MAG: hypothetical protein Kow0013_15110 [Pararhodobacter sp.]
MTKLLIVGDSHTGALERGRARLAEAGALPAGIDWIVVPLGTGAGMNQPFWTPHRGRARLTQRGYRQRMPLIPPEDEVVDAIGLSMPLWYGRVLRGLIRSGVAPVGSGVAGRPLSRALFAHVVRSDMAFILDLVAFLRDGGLPVFAIEPPGIFRDNRFLLSHGAGDLLALQSAIQAVQRKALAELGVPCVDLPPEATDETGLMRSAFRHEDPTDRHHANAAFGALMIRRIADHLPALLAAQAPPSREAAR